MGVATCDHLGSDPQHQGGCGCPLPSAATFITSSGQMPNFSRGGSVRLTGEQPCPAASVLTTECGTCMPCHFLGGDASSTFPPPARVTRALLKIELDGAFSILRTAPCWPSRVWFPKLVRSLAGQPLRLPPASRPTGPTPLSRVVLHQGEISLSLPDQDSRHPDLGCLAPIRESLIKEGFSEEAALMAAQGRRPSTLNL